MVIGGAFSALADLSGRHAASLRTETVRLKAPPLPLSWPVTINPDVFLKKFCLYDSRIYSTQSYICLGTNQALLCIAGDPPAWSLERPARSWC
mgnify:CR=1 FL=1